ncbi:ATP-binding protein [Neobacillus cucumis]|uniref:ATP-binding protein n=1 Tax=Neobacillus cucumis TaxID=1740721 RepID=UPI00196555A0|nr:ATP-binding protein [Neobacillus cucumis]MBM7650747.1 PAS domain S-box-containing protein [Neobacillus cucumis]
MIRTTKITITKKYLLIFSAVFLIPSFVIYQVIVGYAHKVLEADIIHRNKISAGALVNRLNNEVNNVVLQLQLVADTKSRETMFERAKHTISQSSIIHSIYLIDANKQVQFEAPFNEKGNGQIYQYPQFEQMRWTYTYTVSGLIQNYRKEDAVTVAIPLITAGHTFQGVLVAELSRDYLSDVLKSISDTQGGFSSLLDEDGRVIASTDRKEWGKKMDTDAVQSQLALDEEGTKESTYHGQASIVAYQTMWSNWGLTLGVPEKVAFQPITKLSLALKAGFAAVFLFSIFFIIFGLRSLIYPIVLLTKWAKYYQKGDFFQRVPIKKRKDELGILYTTMHKMGEGLKKNERFLHDVIESIPYALITVDPKGTITHINGNFARLSGINVQQLKGKKMISLPFELPLYPVGEKEFQLTDLKGKRHIIKLVTSPFEDGMIAVLQDISQLKLWETHFQQSEKLATIGQITTGIAHELKNPLAVLASTTELLKEEFCEGAEPDIIATFIDDIDEEVRRMSGIVADFLNFARTKNDDETWVKMDHLLDRVIHLLRIKFNEAGVEAVRDYPQLVPPILAKPNKLMQVFLNLFLNSMEAMPNGGTVRIKIRKVENATLIVTVSDTGEGISQQDLEWLFNPFYSTKKQGSGLGLTIARDIMIEHGGSIKIESNTEKRQGTTIQCIFPKRTGKGTDNSDYHKVERTIG